MKKGNYSLKSAFKSKQGKVNQLTELQSQVERDEAELANAERLIEYIYLFQHEIMINFFRTDKLGVYNNALSIYF